MVEALQGELDKLTACVHCGLCLSVCPTYVQLGDENDSPRGRLYLMRAVAEGRLDIGDTFERHIDCCLGCRACETACPSGVRYGSLLEQARGQIVQARSSRKSVLDRILAFVLNRIFTSPARLHWLLAPARWARGSQLLRLLAASKDALADAPGFGKAIALLQSTAPVLLDQAAMSPRPETSASNRAVRVELFAGCVMRELFRHTNDATAKVLKANGWNVGYAPEQVCCGALHAHAGYLETARLLAKKNIDLFQKAGDNAPIITNSAGCGAMLKQYGELLEDDPEYRDRAERLSLRVRDVCEFLAKEGFEPGPRALSLRVSLDHPCHLYHGQRIKTDPIEVVRKLKGIQFVPLPDAESCCGSAGIYNLLHPELADRILDGKLDQIRETGAEILLTGNPGCLMHIASGIARRNLPTKVIHPIELIAASYQP